MYVFTKFVEIKMLASYVEILRASRCCKKLFLGQPVSGRLSNLYDS